MPRAPFRHAGGFTLLEIMIVIALIAVMLAIAIPAYTDSIRRSRRAVAQTCLTESSQFMERFYTTNLRYDLDRAGAAVPAPGNCSQDIAQFYTIEFAAAPTATTYQLRAVPQGEQAEELCGTLTLDNTGARGQSGGTAADCWR